MTLFEQVKECVTARQAAVHYGIKVKRNGMACCPFHKDRHPRQIKYIIALHVEWVAMQ